MYNYEEMFTEPPQGFLVVDLETTTNPEGRFRAIDGEKPYLVGVRGEFAPSIGIRSCALDMTADIVSQVIVEPFKVLVGHNIKFDLEHIRRSDCIAVSLDSLYDYIQKKAVVLDTQFLTYLHSGHQKQFVSLEDACAYWGVPAFKTIKLSDELEKVGHDITKVPNIVTYLHNDLEMTTLLIHKIIQDDWFKRNFGWILKMHDGYMGTFEIEYNGMHVDPSRLSDLETSVKIKHSLLEAWLQGFTGVPEFEPSSNDHVAAYLFGGDIEIETRVPNGVYASGKKVGQPRFKIERRSHRFEPRHTPLPEWKSAKTGKYAVNEDVLLSIGTAFTEKLLEYRELSKLLGTYLTGLSKHLRITDEKYYVFPQINTCATATGRTSSSKPNMQNNPTHDSVGVASIYTSRYGDAGILLEVDFKQIEILALAIISGDKQLIDDILSGRDIHEETGRPVFGGKMTKEQRRAIKTINFGLIYGGGAETLAAQAKVSKSTAINAINSFYKRYEGVRDYFERNKAETQVQLDIAGELTGVIHPNGQQQKIIWIESPTGRRYSFKDYFSDKRRTVEVSHTETRNYRIQGFATGDLVLTALGDVWRALLTRYGDDVKLVGLVHDSLRFDVKLDRLDDLVLQLKYMLENAGKSLNTACKRDDVWTLPIKVTFSKGVNFSEMEEFDAV